MGLEISPQGGVDLSIKRVSFQYKKMTNEKNQTITYYDDPANAYADQTVNADMSAIYERFQKYLAPGAAVLDAGCGSGRDSLHFMKAGYAVTAIDASQEMCAFASRLLQQEVRRLRFQELDYDACFDGIWACASLLHVPERQQAEVFRRLMRALVPGGVLYASWKYGEAERTEASSGRLFCDMTEQRAEALAKEAMGAEPLQNSLRHPTNLRGDQDLRTVGRPAWTVSIEACWISEDVRADRRSQKWLNVIFRKG